MKILFLCHRIPFPPNKGEKIRAFYQLRAMAERHEVDVFTMVDQTADLEHQRPLADYCKSLTIAQIRPTPAKLRALPYLLTKTPLTLPYFFSSELQRKVTQALTQKSYDRIFLYSSSMAQYVEQVNDIPILMDLVDVDSNKWMQYASFSSFPFSLIHRREGLTLREYERKICERSACVLVTTEKEAQLARQLSNQIRVEVISMGVDNERFRDVTRASDASAPTIVFTGDMSYFPNAEAVISFAHNAFPIIKRSLPDVRFLIVGRNPGRKVQALSQIAGIEVTGSVPDVRVYLAQAHVAVTPLSIAAGIQTKILEAMGYGLPVVATPCTIQALAPSVAEIVEKGSTPDELALKTIWLLQNPKIAREKGLEGRQRVMAAYTWEQPLGRLLQLIEDPKSAGSSPRESQFHTTR